MAKTSESVAATSVKRVIGWKLAMMRRESK